MYILLMCRSLTMAQKAEHLLRDKGIFAAVTKAPQSANPRGCTYGVKIAERNLNFALSELSAAGIPILKQLEYDGRNYREVRR